MNPPGANGAKPPKCLVVIGASTGGTRVLSDLFRRLPPLPAAFLIVQHMPRFINDSLVRTLGQRTAFPVQLAEDFAALGPGQVWLAPSEVHCAVFQNRAVRLLATPPVNYVCPSVDVTMQSLNPPALGQKLIGVLLTGMGKDGAAGLAHIKRVGGLTITQNKATCAVYGMPAAAVKLGCVDYELAPEQIAALLTREIR